MPKYRPRDGIEALAERYGPTWRKHPPISINLAFKHKLSTIVTFKDDTYVALAWRHITDTISIRTNNPKFIDRFLHHMAPGMLDPNHGYLHMLLETSNEPAILMFLAAMGAPKNVSRF